MRRVLTAVMLCGLAVGCGGSKSPPDDSEANRRAEEEGRLEGQREDAEQKAQEAEARKKNKGKRVVNPDD